MKDLGENSKILPSIFDLGNQLQILEENPTPAANKTQDHGKKPQSFRKTQDIQELLVKFTV